MLTSIIATLKTYQAGSNTGYDYLVATLLFVGLLAGLKIFQLIILARLRSLAKKTRTDFDDVLIDVFISLKPPVYFLIALFFAIKALTLPILVSEIVKVLFIIVLVYEAVQVAAKIIDYGFKKYIEKREDGAAKYESSIMRTIRGILKAILWIIGILLVLSNLGVNVTSIVASLGIGGLAVALALQNILSDIFSSFSIYIDKPFREGDFIIIGSDMGVVQKIGIKSTRIKTLHGEELVISNRELTGARVQNYKKMDRRRVVFSLGVTYDTKPEKLEKVPDIIKEVINNITNVDFDRCHFQSYGDFSLNFETVFYVNSPDYNTYMDAREKINLEIYKRFAKEKIGFAYPTQTIYINKG